MHLSGPNQQLESLPFREHSQKHRTNWKIPDKQFSVIEGFLGVSICHPQWARLENGLNLYHLGTQDLIITQEKSTHR